jgi:hypothetical protein
MKYQQLTQDERYMISQLRQQGCEASEIARFMARDRSTIWRELKRNMVQTAKGLTYCVSKAQEQRNGRLRRSRRGAQHSAEDYALVRRLLLEQWSPEQIAGTLGRLNELRISHQTIYRYIRRDWRSGGVLWQQLRRRYKRRKRHYGLERRGRLQGKPMIETRPEGVEDRQEVGHYEGDTVHGASWEKTCVVTVVERTTGTVVGGEVTRPDGEVSQQSIDQPSAPVAVTGADIDVGQRNGVPRISGCAGRDRSSNLLCQATPSVAARQQREHKRATTTVLAETRIDGETDPTSVQPDCPQAQHTTKETPWLSQPLTTHSLSVALGG